jgi:type IV secretory pathway VirB3-like protein
MTRHPSATALTARPVVKSLHRPLTLCGIDRRLFFLALMAGAATFNLFYSFAAGLAVSAALYAGALVTTWHDPHALQIVLASSRVRRRYDVGKHVPARVEVR